MLPVYQNLNYKLQRIQWMCCLTNKVIMVIQKVLQWVLDLGRVVSLLNARRLEYSSLICLAALRLNQYKLVAPRWCLFCIALNLVWRNSSENNVPIIVRSVSVDTKQFIFSSEIALKKQRFILTIFICSDISCASQFDGRLIFD